METVTGFISLGFKITADGDCSHEIKRHFLGRKAMTNLDSILKSRDITLLANVHIVKAMVFPVIMYGCESLDHKEGWELKNWCFQTVVLEKTLESPLDSKEIKPVNPKGNQPWIFIGRTDDEAETPIFWPPDLKSRLISKDPAHWQRPWCWERLKVGREGDDRGWDGWMASPTQWTWVWVGSRSWWRTGKPGVLQSMGLQRVGHNWVTELNWTYWLHIHILEECLRFPLNIFNTEVQCFLSHAKFSGLLGKLLVWGTPRVKCKAGSWLGLCFSQEHSDHG